MSIKQWACICGFTHQLTNVQSHFLEEHKLLLDDCVSCGICNVKFSDPFVLKQHSVIHIQRCSNNTQQQFIKPIHILPSNNIEMCNQTMASTIGMTNFPSAATSSTNSVKPICSDQLNNGAMILNHCQLLTITKETINVLHPQANDPALKQYLNSHSILEQQTSLGIQNAYSIINHETNHVSRKECNTKDQSTMQLYNSSDDCKVWSNFKVNNALKKMLQPNKLVHFYKCMEKECSFTTNDCGDFLIHLVRHNLSCFKCVYCFSDFASGLFLTNHMLEKHGGRQYQCGLCLYRASMKLYVVVHHQVHHKNDELNVLTCSSPQSTKTSEDALDVDYSLYAKAYRCSLGKCCFETFDPEDFKVHNNTHHGSVCMYPCSYCEASCFSIGRLIQHYQLHGINNYQCTYCLYGSTTKRQLLFHLCVMHADMPVNVYVRSSGDPTLDLQNNFMNDNGYNMLSSLTHCSNKEETIFPNTIIDVTETRKIKLEKSEYHLESSPPSMFIKNNDQLRKRAKNDELNSICDNLDKFNPSTMTLENLNRHIEKNDRKFSLFNAESKEQLKLKKSVACRKKRKHLDRYVFAKKRLRHSNVGPGVQIYDCCICSASLLSLRDATRHIRIVHCVSHLFTCSYCPRSAMNEETLRHHIITKHINRDVITRSFISKRICKKTNAKFCRYRCSFCMFGTQEKETIKDHLCKELNYNTYSCGICRIQLLNETNIVNHFTANHPDECIIFTRDRNSDIEAWIEKSLQRFTSFQKSSSNTSNTMLCCPLCHRELPTAKKLLCHLYQHKQYKRYQCNHCNKRFVKFSHFIQHKKAIKKGSSDSVSVLKMKVPFIERWANEIIQNIKAQHKNSNLNSKISCNRRKFAYTDLDIHLAGIYKCFYCCFCTNDKYAVKRHCRVKHFKKHTRFSVAGQISRKKKLLGYCLHKVQCWQCKKKEPKHRLTKHRLKHCKWESYEKHSYNKKMKLNNCNNRKKYICNNIYQKCVTPFNNTRTDGSTTHLQIQEKKCIDNQIFSCYCCQEKFCSLKLFHMHWQDFHAYNNGPFIFQLPIMKTEGASKTYVYKCFYCNNKSLVFNVLKDHVKRCHPSRIFKIKIICEAVENVSFHKNENPDVSEVSDNMCEQLVSESNLCDSEESKINDENITINIRVEGLSNSLRLPVSYLAKLCNIQPVVILKDVL